MPSKKKVKKSAKKHHRKYRKAPPPALNTLHTPALQVIFSFLCVTDLTELMLTSKRFAAEAALDQAYWKQAHLQHFRLISFPAIHYPLAGHDWYARYKSAYNTAYPANYLYFHDAISTHSKRTLTLIKSGDFQRFLSQIPKNGYNFRDLVGESTLIALAACPSQALRDYIYQTIVLPHHTQNETRDDIEAKVLVHWAALLNQQTAINDFISRNIDVCLLDSKGYPPLYYAIIAGNLPMVELLIPAMENHPSGNQLIPHPTSLLSFNNIKLLQLAVRYQYLDIVKTLITHGLNVNGVFRNVDYTPPLTIAAKGGNQTLATFLLSQGADANKTPTALDGLDGEQRTAIHLATDNEDLEMIALLLAHGADIENSENTTGTPLMLAVLNRFDITAKYLLDHKANPNTADRNHLLPIDAAAKTENLFMLKLLLSYGAIVDNTYGNTARHYAETSLEMTKTLHHAQLKQYIATNPSSLFAATALKAVVKGKADVSTLKKHRRTLGSDKNLKKIYKHVAHP